MPDGICIGEPCHRGQQHAHPCPIPEEVVHITDQKGHLWLHWPDGASDEQEPFDFTLVVTAVDPRWAGGARVGAVADSASG